MDARSQRIQQLRSELARRRGMAMQDEQQPQDASQAHEGIADKLMNNPVIGGLTNATLGAGDAFQKFGMGITGHQFTPSSEGGMYEAGNLAGNVGLWALLSRVGAGGLAKLGAGGRTATAGAPAVGNIANIAKSLAGAGRVPTAIRGATTGAVIGGADDQESPGMGAIEGAAMGAAPQVLGAGLQQGKKLANYLNVDKYARSIYDKLGGGETIQGNAKAFAKQVKSKVDYLKDRYKNTTDAIFDKFKDRNDYPVDYWKAMKDEEPMWNGEHISTDVKDFANKLIKNKDLDSAHELQKQLGDEMAFLKRKVDNGTADTKEKNMYRKYTDWYYDSKNTITDYLKKHDPEAATKWNKASDFWRDRIAPFHSDTMLARISKGKEKNPIGFHDIFKAPESQMDYVTKALGEQGKRKIAFSHIGTVKEMLDPEYLRAKLLNMKGNSGLESAMPKGTEELANELDKRLNLRSKAGLVIPRFRRKPVYL